MKKAGIVIDSWKFEIFDRNLRQSGYVYEEAPSITEKTRTLLVKTDNLEALALVVQKSNNEAAKSKMN